MKQTKKLQASLTAALNIVNFVDKDLKGKKINFVTIYPEWPEWKDANTVVNDTELRDLFNSKGLYIMSDDEIDCPSVEIGFIKSK